MEKWKQLLCIVPEPPKWQIDWPKIETFLLDRKDEGDQAESVVARRRGCVDTYDDGM